MAGSVSTRLCHKVDAGLGLLMAILIATSQCQVPA
jgi:hypothetical protein